VKIGIFETDRLDHAIQEKHGSYSTMFQTLLSAVDDRLVFETYDVVHFEYPENVTDCDAYLITGSKSSPYEDKAWMRRLEEEIRLLHAREKKLIGICFGHQLIAQALGGEVKKSDLGWGVGLATQHLMTEKPWMGKVAKTFQILVSHQDQVTKLPPEAECIAGNDFCPNGGFQVGQHMLTFQGHPEFQPAYLRQLISGRREIIGAPRAAQALASLDAPNDHPQIARWILDFLKTA